MASNNRITLTRLIQFIGSFNQEKDIINHVDNVFINSIKSNDEHVFSTLKYPNSDTCKHLPTKLTSIFNPFIKGFKRFGYRSTLNDINNYNMSLIFSIISNISSSFYTMSQTDQFNNIINIRDQLLDFIIKDDNFATFGYNSLSWNIKDVINSIKTFKSNRLIIRLIVDYFAINLFLLNITEDKIYSICTDDKFDPFRKSLFILFYNDYFEPIQYNGMGLIDSDNEIIKKLINVDKLSICVLDADINVNKISKLFTVEPENLDKYKIIIPIIQTIPVDGNMANDNNKIVEQNNVSDVGIIEDDPKPVIDINNLKRMKLTELQTLAQQYGIDTVVGRKKKTKAELIDEISAITKKIE